MSVVDDGIDAFCVASSFTDMLSATATRLARLPLRHFGRCAFGITGTTHPHPMRRFPIHAPIRPLAVDPFGLLSAVWVGPSAKAVTQVVELNDILEAAEDSARSGFIARVTAPVGAEPPERFLSTPEAIRRTSAGTGLSCGAFLRSTSLRTIDIAFLGAAPGVTAIASLPP